MANIITAGNSTNGGTAITTDTSGTLNIVTGSGSGSNAITIDASQAVVMPGNLTVTGTLTASNGVSGSIRSGTIVASTSGTSIDFTSLPTGLKRITVMFNGVSLSGTAYIAIQLGDSGGIENSGYVGGSGNTGGAIVANSTFFSLAPSSSAAATFSGLYNISLMDSTTNLWAISGNSYQTGYSMSLCGGSKSLSATLDRLRITTSNGTDTFDAGSINILYE